MEQKKLLRVTDQNKTFIADKMKKALAYEKNSACSEMCLQMCRTKPIVVG
jgi:hypothetical protein